MVWRRKKTGNNKVTFRASTDRGQKFGSILKLDANSIISVKGKAVAAN
jgi:hypothetical protein